METCTHGHPRTVENTWTHPRHGRRCRICARAKAERRRRRAGALPQRRANAAVQQPTVVDLAWAAGFLEGEAWFGIAGRNIPRPYPAVECSQVDWEPIAHLIRIFGGLVYRHHRRPDQTQALTWRVNGARARGVMMTLYPFLTSARRRAAIRAALA